MRICFLGDSFTNGTGDAACLGWAGRACIAARDTGVDVTYYNLGIRGETSADIAASWRGEAERRLPADCNGKLVFSFGANDCATGDDGRERLNAMERTKNARAILIEAPKKWPTLVVGPLPIVDDEAANKRIEAYSQQLAELCKAHSVPYLNVFSAANESPDWYEEAESGDGTHPSSKGYSLVADAFMDWPVWQGWLDKA